MNKKQIYAIIGGLIGFIVLIIVIINIIPKKEQKTEEKTGNLEETKELQEQEELNIFEEFYDVSREKVSKMTLDEKIGQIFLVRYPEKKQVETLKEYNFGGYLLFEKDFKNKKEEEIKEEINNLQKESKVPLLIAVDEEGGKVVRVSSNKNLRDEKFKSPRELYEEGGFERIKEDTKEKSRFLENLGITREKKC